MKRLFLLLCCGMAFSSFAQTAKETEYPHAIIAPNSYANKATKINRVVKINAKLKNGELITWTLIYDGNSRKLGTMSFSRPESYAQKDFAAKADALNTTAFWDDIYSCLQKGEAELGDCVNPLIIKHFEQ